MKALVTLSVISLLFSLGLNAAAEVIRPQDRVLIIVDELDTAGIDELQPLYSALEDITVGLPNLPLLQDSYREIHSLRNSNATLAKFRQVSRQLAARPEIKAIDVFMVLHGRTNKLLFRDGTVRMDDMVDFMNAASSTAEQAVVNRVKRKFRMLYNTSCFGSSHRSAFRTIGFDAVVGSIGVNANSEVEYPSFLVLWNTGSTFSQSFAPTNNSAALALTDGPLVATGNFFNNFLKNVNSKKVFSGNTSIRITTPAL